MLRKTLFSALGLGALASTASGNAFNINEHDARVTGRAGATAASNTEPSSIVFNPGGIAINEGTNVALGTAIYFAQGSYKSDTVDKVKTDSDPQLVPNLFVTSRVHDMVAVGVGLHFPFGLAVEWPTGHPQSDGIQSQTLRTYFITAGAGLNLHQQVPGLSFGAAIDIVPATIELEQTVTFGDVQGSAHLGADAVGVGGRAGVMYHSPDVPGLKVGVMYRSPVKLDFKGKGDFDIPDPYRSQLPPDGDIDGKLTLPQQVWGGVSYSPIPQLDIEYDAVWINWANAFEDGDLKFNLPDDGNPATPRPFNASPQDYKNTVTHRLGLEYRLVPQNAAIRAGFMYDPTPIPSTTLSARLPDANRINVTLGGSYQITPDYGVHLGLLWVTPQEKETSDDQYMPQFKGTYGVQAFVANLGLSGRFGH